MSDTHTPALYFEKPSLYFEKPSYEWMVIKGKSFGVLIRAWHKYDGLFGWNLYACIYENHPYFDNVEKAINLPFHGGATYDEFLSCEPAQGLRYDWEKVRKCLKVGCDYSHLYDDFFERSNPFDGVPSQIQSDALELVEHLNAAMNQVSAVAV